MVQRWNNLKIRSALTNKALLIISSSTQENIISNSIKKIYTITWDYTSIANDINKKMCQYEYWQYNSSLKMYTKR